MIRGKKMIWLQNIGYDEFIYKYGNKKIICFGAGGTLRDFLNNHMEKVSLLEQIEVILDNCVCKTGRQLKINRRMVPIMDLNTFLLSKPHMEDYIIIVSVADKYLQEILEQLDTKEELNNVVCIYGLQALLWDKGVFHAPMPMSEPLPVCGKRYEIPAIIHYCWFGSRKMSQLNHKCVESWKRYCPNYEMRFWNEENYDISQTPDYVQEAYKAEKYAFVSDYVRLDVVHQYGGFYFDVDVELLREIDVFRSYKSVFSFMEYNEVATGLGFGSMAGTMELAEMMERYQNIEFIREDGSYNLLTCANYDTDYFKRKGFRIDNFLQIRNDILLLPSSCFCPLNPVRCSDGYYNLSLLALTDNSYGIHWCDNTWKNRKEQKAFEEKKKYLKEINGRLLRDWIKHNGETSYEKSGDIISLL